MKTNISSITHNRFKSSIEKIKRAILRHELFILIHFQEKILIVCLISFYLQIDTIEALSRSQREPCSRVKRNIIPVPTYTYIKLQLYINYHFIHII